MKTNVMSCICGEILYTNLTDSRRSDMTSLYRLDLTHEFAKIAKVIDAPLAYTDLLTKIILEDMVIGYVDEPTQSKGSFIDNVIGMLEYDFEQVMPHDYVTDVIGTIMCSVDELYSAYTSYYHKLLDIGIRTTDMICTLQRAGLLDIDSRDKSPMVILPLHWDGNCNSESNKLAAYLTIYHNPQNTLNSL